MIGRGFDRRSTCLTCGKPYGSADITYGGRCLNCVGDDRVKDILSPQNQDIGTDPRNVANWHGLQHENKKGHRGFHDDDEDTPLIGRTRNYVEKFGDFADTVDFGNYEERDDYDYRGLKRGTLEKPWGYGRKYHTEGDVGT